jgi:hypothetical protein
MFERADPLGPDAVDIPLNSLNSPENSDEDNLAFSDKPEGQGTILLF